MRPDVEFVRFVLTRSTLIERSTVNVDASTGLVPVERRLMASRVTQNA